MIFFRWVFWFGLCSRAVLISPVVFGFLCEFLASVLVSNTCWIFCNVGFLVWFDLMALDNRGDSADGWTDRQTRRETDCESRGGGGLTRFRRDRYCGGGRSLLVGSDQRYRTRLHLSDTLYSSNVNYWQWFPFSCLIHRVSHVKFTHGNQPRCSHVSSSYRPLVVSDLGRGRGCLGLDCLGSRDMSASNHHHHSPWINNQPHQQVTNRIKTLQGKNINITQPKAK